MKEEKIWYKSISNWLFIVACTILGIMLIINLSVMYQAKKDENTVPSVFGYKPFMVLSGSMESAIHKGDLIFTKIIDPETLKINDVIAFRDAAGTITTHRIIDIVSENGENQFITKGDNNNSQDKHLVSLEDVEGLYVGRIPGIGSLMSSLSEPTTIIILVLGVTAIFVISFSISNKKQRELERQEFLEYKKSREELDERRKNNPYEEYWEFKRMQEEKEKQKTEIEKDEDFWNYDNKQENENYYNEEKDEVWDYNKYKDVEEVKNKPEDNKFSTNSSNMRNQERLSSPNRNNKPNYNKNRDNYSKYNQKNNYNNKYNNAKLEERNRDNNYNKPKNKNYNNSGYNKSKNYSPNRNNQNKNYGNYNQHKNNNGQIKKERPHDKEWEEFMAYKKMKEQQDNIKKD